MNKEKLRNLFEGCKDKKAISKEFGMTYQSMYNLIYKDDTSCKVDSLERIARYFGTTVGYFFDEELLVDFNKEGQESSNCQALSEEIKKQSLIIQQKDIQINKLLEIIKSLSAKK